MPPRLRGMLLISLMVFVTSLNVGCDSTRTVFVNPTDHDLIRLGPEIRGRVYLWNGVAWQLTDHPVLLPEGWYAGYVSPAGDDPIAPESDFPSLSADPDLENDKKQKGPIRKERVGRKKSY